MGKIDFNKIYINIDIDLYENKNYFKNFSSFRNKYSICNTKISFTKNLSPDISYSKDDDILKDESNIRSLTKKVD